MAESPAFQFYPSDFTGSSTVGTANANEICAYTMLLCLDWMEHGFAFDEERLARWCRISRPAFKKAWAHLAAKFPPRDGRHYNPRLEKERAKQAEHRERQANRGRAGAEKRWHGDGAGHSGGHSASTPQAMAQGVPDDSGKIALSVSHLSSLLPTTNNNYLPATPKPPASRPKDKAAKKPRATWLTPFGTVWEAANGAGSFPWGQAASELKPLRDAGLGDAVIAGRLAWYLRVKGLEHPDPTPEMLERTRFTPSLRDFRLRHGKFAAGDPKPDVETGAAT